MLLLLPLLLPLCLAGEPEKPSALGRLIALGAADGFGALQKGDAHCLLHGAGSERLYEASRRFVALALHLGLGPEEAPEASKEGLAALVGSLQALIELEGAVAATCLPHEALVRLRRRRGYINVYIYYNYSYTVYNICIYAINAALMTLCFCLYIAFFSLSPPAVVKGLDLRQASDALLQLWRGVLCSH